MSAEARRPLLAPGPAGLLLLVLLVLFVLAPWPLDIKMRALGFGLDPQRPHHSFIFDSEPMPIEARKVGIYGGFGLAAAWLALRAPRAGRLARPGGYLLALTGIAVMGFDGTNALLYDLGAPHLYAPRLDLRVGTGFVAGLAMAALLWPVWAATAWREPVGAVRLRDYAAPAAVATGIILGLVTGQAWLAAPAALIATGGLVSVVTLLNGVGVLVATRREGTAETTSELIGVLAVAVVLAIGELLGLAALRYALIGTTPLP